MKIFAPDYYGDFACRKGACRHSCCVGWEIDIDECSLARYRQTSGEMGKRLRANIETDGNAPHFRLTAGERCPFLTGEGLCELILRLGADSLCQICADHPRYRNFFSDHVEVGLGMCCEAACELILRRSAPVGMQVVGEDGAAEEPVTEDEAYLLSLRDALVKVVQDRGLSVERRVEAMLATAGVLPAYDAAHWAAFLLGLERLDEAWTVKLRALEGRTGAPLPEEPALEIAFEQLMLYLLQRHLPAALEDDDLAGRAAFCGVVWHTLRAMLAREEARDLPALAELCRLYSSEIEYSDENVCAMLDEIHRLGLC